MSLTIGFTAMDPATEAALKSAFASANARLQNHWQLLPDGEADHVIIDLDSMYGPMSWLRLHAAGKQVIGLTSAARAQTDHRLGRPFDEDSVATLLQDIAGLAGVDLSAPSTAAAVDSVVNAPAADSAQPEPVSVAVTETVEETLAPIAESAEPETIAPEVAIETVETLETPDEVATTEDITDIEEIEEIEEEAIEAVEEIIEPPRERDLGDWLAPGVLGGRVRYQRDSGPRLLIDLDNRTYHGPATLKPVAPYFDGIVEGEALEPLDADTWTRDADEAGAPQPLSRLVWLGGLVSGKGQLKAGFDPLGRYRLVKWPQTEREYPRHFRIATAMMKGPSTLADIAAASSVPLEDVADFVNANLATGFAEFVPEAVPEPAEPPKPSGLFGRLRGK